jgi:hypothetical protein
MSVDNTRNRSWTSPFNMVTDLCHVVFPLLGAPGENTKVRQRDDCRVFAWRMTLSYMYFGLFRLAKRKHDKIVILSYYLVLTLPRGAKVRQSGTNQPP